MAGRGGGEGVACIWLLVIAQSGPQQKSNLRIGIVPLVHARPAEQAVLRPFPVALISLAPRHRMRPCEIEGPATSAATGDGRGVSLSRSSTGLGPRRTSKQGAAGSGVPAIHKPRRVGASSLARGGTPHPGVVPLLHTAAGQGRQLTGEATQAPTAHVESCPPAPRRHHAASRPAEHP